MAVRTELVEALRAICGDPHVITQTHRLRTYDVARGAGRGLSGGRR